MVPVGLLRVLSEFVVYHYASKGFKVEPDGMGETCGILARAWAIENQDLLSVFDLDAASVQAFGARFGKHLGNFFMEEGGA